MKNILNCDLEHINKIDLVRLLASEGCLQQELFQLAREVRRQYSGDEVFLRGVIEISNVCQKNCDYCAMRSNNKELKRYALHADEILSLATSVKDSGLSVLFLQGGQNPCNDRLLEQVIPIIKKELGLNVLLCLGERPKHIYNKFALLGADSYILKFETSDKILYKELTNTSLTKRLRCLHWIKAAGLKLGTGNIVGLPHQTLEGLAEDILLGIKIQPDFISSSPFTPNQSTPLQHHAQGNLNLTLNSIAISRILLKTPLVPSVSALEYLHKGGQKLGLDSGANVMTINFTPKGSLENYKIYSERRFVVNWEHVLQTVDRAGLKIHTNSSD